MHFTDTDGTVTLTTLSSQVLDWLSSDTQSKYVSVGKKVKILKERKLVMDRFHQSLPGEVHVTSHKKQTFTNTQHKQPTTSNTTFERAAQEYEQPACDEAHVAIAKSHRNVQSGKCGQEEVFSEKQAEHIWTSQQVTLLIEMKSVASNALENPFIVAPGKTEMLRCQRAVRYLEAQIAQKFFS